VTDHLFRSPTDRVIAGVAGGLAVWLNIDPSLVRLAWVLLAIFSGGIFVLVYIVMMIVVPLPPPGWAPQRPAGGAPGGSWNSGGWTQPGPGGGWGQGGGQGSGWAQGGTPPPAGGWSSPPSAAQGWTPPSSSRNAGIVVGAVLIVLGAWFLVDRYVSIDWSLVWPVAVIALGLGLMAVAIRRGQAGDGR
jgi:phage shock protein PspC (stress-responsive transcriptional regulator)